MGQLHRLCPVICQNKQVHGSCFGLGQGDCQLIAGNLDLHARRIRPDRQGIRNAQDTGVHCQIALYRGIQGAGGGIQGQFRGSARRGDGQSLGHGDAVASEAHAERRLGIGLFRDIFLFGIADNRYAILLNDCKYGYDVHNNVMRLTLLKSATYPDYLQDQGEHHFTYSLYPHAGDVHHCAMEKEAFYLNNPIRVYAGSHLPMELLGIAGDCDALDAVKWTEDDSGIILRLHEYKGARGKMILILKPN